MAELNWRWRTGENIFVMYDDNWRGVFRDGRVEGRTMCFGIEMYHVRLSNGREVCTSADPEKTSKEA